MERNHDALPVSGPDRFPSGRRQGLSEMKGLLRNDQVKTVVIKGKGFGGALYDLTAPFPNGLLIEAPGKIDGPEGRINAINVAFRNFFQKTGNGLATAAADVQNFCILRRIDLGRAPTGKGALPGDSWRIRDILPFWDRARERRMAFSGSNFMGMTSFDYRFILYTIILELQGAGNGK